MSRSVGLRVLAGCALAALLCAARPAAGLAQTPSAEPAEYHFSTSIATAYGSQYPITGHLDLQIYPNGILRGYYHNAYQKEYIQVNGGRDGGYLWFDIGPSNIDLGIAAGTPGRIHVIATMNADNSFRGQAYPEYPEPVVIGDIQGRSPSEQYVFAAKPIEKSAEDYPGPGAPVH